MILPYGILEEALSVKNLTKYIRQNNIPILDGNSLYASLIQRLGTINNIPFNEVCLQAFGTTEQEIRDACNLIVELAQAGRLDELVPTNESIKILYEEDKTPESAGNFLILDDKLGAILNEIIKQLEESRKLFRDSYQTKEDIINSLKGLTDTGFNKSIETISTKLKNYDREYSQGKNAIINKFTEDKKGLLAKFTFDDKNKVAKQLQKILKAIKEVSGVQNDKEDYSQKRFDKRRKQRNATIVPTYDEQEAQETRQKHEEDEYYQRLRRFNLRHHMQGRINDNAMLQIMKQVIQSLPADELTRLSQLNQDNKKPENIPYIGKNPAFDIFDIPPSERDYFYNRNKGEIDSLLSWE